MKSNVIENIENFLNDFQYFKLEKHELFQQLVHGGSKLIGINTTPYDDGLMLDIQLAIRVDKVEQYIFGFYDQEKDKLSLTYWESLSNVCNDIPKRSFVQNEIELSKVLAEIEDALVKNGFNWLDRLSDVQELSKHIDDMVFNTIQKPVNIFNLCQRGYLIRILLEEKMTDSSFYEYYEQMQLHKLPEHQLEEFLQFKNFLRE